MIGAAIILAFVIIFLAAALVPEEVEGPILALSVLSVVLVAAICFDVGCDRATADYAHGRITIEKIPVVTKEIR